MQLLPQRAHGQSRIYLKISGTSTCKILESLIKEPCRKHPWEQLASGHIKSQLLCFSPFPIKLISRPLQN